MKVYEESVTGLVPKAKVEIMRRREVKRCNRIRQDYLSFRNERKEKDAFKKEGKSTF